MPFDSTIDYYQPGGDVYGPGKYGFREDGTLKGEGFFGMQDRSDSSLQSSELSGSSDLQKDGKTVLYPLMQPTLNKDEYDVLLSGDLSQSPLRDSIYGKGEAHAAQRLQQGKSQWAEPGEVVPRPYKGKQNSMTDPNAIVDQISSGLKTLSLDNLMKGTVDPKKHIEGVLNSGPGADAKKRQQTWQPPIESAAQPGFRTKMGQPTAESLTATDAASVVNANVAKLALNSSGAVMGANGTKYDKNARPIQVAMNQHAQDQLDQIQSGPRPAYRNQAVQDLQQPSAMQPGAGVTRGKAMTEAERAAALAGSDRVIGTQEFKQYKAGRDSVGVPAVSLEEFLKGKR